MDELEEKLYEIAGGELASKDVNRGIWSKAFSEALGEEAKTRAIYIKLRVDALRREVTAQAERDAKLANERAKPDKDRIRKLLAPLRCRGFKDTDHIPRDKFVGSPNALGVPVSTAKAADMFGMLEFEIIDYIKLGYLRGVYYRDQWYFDLEGTNP
jgi:hypothetical protein